MSTFGDPARRLRLGLAGLLAAALSAGLLAAPAEADPSPVGIGVVRLDATERGTFTVPAWTDAPGASLISVTATLTAPGTTPVDVPLTRSGSADLWTPSTPLTLTSAGGPMPHLGHYAIAVEATDGTNTASRTDVGTLNYTERLQFAPDPATGVGPHATQRPTNTDRHAVLTGQLVGIDPGTGIMHPLPGRTVDVTRPAYAGVADSTAQTQTPTTDATGRFTTTAFDQDRQQYYTVTATGHDEQVDDTLTADAYVPVVQLQGSITVRSAPTRVEEGRPITITGTAYRDQNGGSPADHVSVVVSLSSDAVGVPNATVVTDGHGAFRATVTAVAAGGEPVSWSASIVDPFVYGSSTGTVIVPPAAAYSHVSVSLAATGRVTATGTLTYTYGGYAEVDQTTYLDYSSDGRTGWRALAHVTPDGTAVRLAANGYVAGYYRLRHVVSDEMGSAVSAPVRRSRIDTYVFANDATPEPIAKGRTLSVSGTLKQYVGGWHPMAHTRVYLYFLPKGSHTYKYVTTGTTDAHGRATLHARATADGYWQLHYFGDSSHFDSGDSDDYVDVR